MEGAILFVCVFYAPTHRESATPLRFVTLSLNGFLRFYRFSLPQLMIHRLVSVQFLPHEEHSAMPRTQRSGEITAVFIADAVTEIGNAEFNRS